MDDRTMPKEYRSRPRDKAAEFIESYIIKNKLEPRQKIPSERSLCKAWGFNRATLRSAIHKLAVKGVVYSRPGSGTFVAAPKLVRNLQDMESLTRIVERANKTLDTIHLYAGIIECNKQIAKKMELVLGHKIFMLQRMRTMDQIPFLLETTYLDYERCKGIESYDFSKVSLYMTLEQNFGIKVDHGVEHLSITYAGTEECRLLEIPLKTSLFFISGISVTSGGDHIEYFESVVRADQVRFTSTLTRK
jgi:GntR family transcriptional regulator